MLGEPEGDDGAGGGDLPLRSPPSRAVLRRAVAHLEHPDADIVLQEGGDSGDFRTDAFECPPLLAQVFVSKV